MVVNFISKDIKNNGVFYTDSNGLEMQKRILNHRDNWNFYTKSPVSGNYYPITSAIAIRDSENQMAILTGRCHVGTSVKDGVVEIMQNRRLYSSDNKGIQEYYGEVYNSRGDYADVSSEGWILFHNYKNEVSL